MLLNCVNDHEIDSRAPVLVMNDVDTTFDETQCTVNIYNYPGDENGKTDTVNSIMKDLMICEIRFLLLHNYKGCKKYSCWLCYQGILKVLV